MSNSRLLNVAFTVVVSLIQLAVIDYLFWTVDTGLGTTLMISMVVLFFSSPYRYGDDIVSFWGGYNPTGSVYSLIGLMQCAEKDANAILGFAQYAKRDAFCWFGFTSFYQFARRHAGSMLGFHIYQYGREKSGQGVGFTLYLQSRSDDTWSLYLIRVIGCDGYYRFRILGIPVWRSALLRKKPLS